VSHHDIEISIVIQVNGMTMNSGRDLVIDGSAWPPLPGWIAWIFLPDNL